MNFAPTPRWALGMRELQPGVFVDRNRALHLDAPGFCVAHGYPPTDENQRVAINALKRDIGEGFAIEEHVERVAA
jgi:hypothetical protein